MSDVKEATDGNRFVVPVLAEEVKVDIASAPAGGVRIIKRIVEEDVVVEEELREQHADVSHTQIGRFVDGPQPIRQTDDELIVPIVEEQVILERRWLLKEELHIIRSEKSSTYRETVTLKREEADVERFDL